MERARCGDLDAALAAHGLMPRGGLDLAAGEVLPPGPDGRPARSLVLVGHAGGSLWPHFCAWREAQPAMLDHPLDRWSRAAIGGVADRFSARAVFPSDRPYLPFQQWAMRAEGLRPSPLGILIHPEYGLWHAWRGALLFSVALGEVPFHAGEPSQDHPCDRCVEKPCLTACPVDAYTRAGFDHAGCRAHVGSSAGEPCRTRGCLDRNACPVGTSYRYTPAQQAFHMAAFLRSAGR